MCLSVVPPVLGICTKAQVGIRHLEVGERDRNSRLAQTLDRSVLVRTWPDPRVLQIACQGIRPARIVRVSHYGRRIGQWVDQIERNEREPSLISQTSRRGSDLFGRGCAAISAGPASY